MIGKRIRFGSQVELEVADGAGTVGIGESMPAGTGMILPVLVSSVGFVMQFMNGLVSRRKH